MTNPNANLARDIVSLEGKVWKLIQDHGLDVHKDGDHVLIKVVGMLLDAQ